MKKIFGGTSCLEDAGYFQTVCARCGTNKDGFGAALGSLISCSFMPMTTPAIELLLAGDILPGSVPCELLEEAVPLLPVLMHMPGLEGVEGVLALLPELLDLLGPSVHVEVVPGVAGGGWEPSLGNGGPWWNFLLFKGDATVSPLSNTKTCGWFLICSASAPKILYFVISSVMLLVVLSFSGLNLPLCCLFLLLVLPVLPDFFSIP